MRRRLVVSTIAIVLVVLGTLAVPVGLIVFRAAEDEARARLEQQAGQISAAIAGAIATGDPVSTDLVTGVVGPADGVRIRDREGTVILERLPLRPGTPLSIARDGPGGTRIEVLTSTADLEDRFRRQVLILLALAGGALVGAAALAAVQARQLARPLERLAATAGRVGAGDFSARESPPTGIAEIDDIAEAVARSAARVDRKLADERSFTADTTHQLRTGLTGIAMRFELLTRSADPQMAEEALAGLDQTAQLDRTIDELLDVVRDRTARERVPFELDRLVREHVIDWMPRYASARRTLTLDSGETATVVGTKGLAGQVIDVLLDNALRHGAGTVVVRVEGGEVTVSDEGPGFEPDQIAQVFDSPTDPAAAHGRGLGLARRLAAVDGGSVEILTARPATVRYRLPNLAAESLADRT